MLALTKWHAGTTTTTTQPKPILALAGVCVCVCVGLSVRFSNFVCASSVLFGSPGVAVLSLSLHRTTRRPRRSF